MSTVTAAIRIALPGLFGSDGRYYEFAHPLDLTVEEDADGIWHHRIADLDLWAYEPTREASLSGLQEVLTCMYEAFVLPRDENLISSARAVKLRLAGAVKSVR